MNNDHDVLCDKYKLSTDFSDYSVKKKKKKDTVTIHN